MKLCNILCFTNRNSLYSHFYKKQPLKQVKSYFNRSLSLPTVKSVNYSSVIKVNTKEARLIHDETFNADLDDLLEAEVEILENVVDNTRNLLYKNSQDVIIQKLNNAASVKDVFTVFQSHKTDFQHEHFTQTVLVLKDFQTILLEIRNDNFFEELNKHEDFKEFINCMESKLEEFDTNTICYVFYYLNKLGHSTDKRIMQKIGAKIKKNLLKNNKNMNLGQASKFFRTTFTDQTLRPYLFTKEIWPDLISKIETINTAEDLEELTMCLSKINIAITPEILERYKNKVRELIRSKILNEKCYKTVLRITIFLNLSHWRDKNALLQSQCISLIKNNVNLLTAQELVNLYDVFFKTQQPGQILSDIQRNAIKHLKLLEEDMDQSIDVQLKLFSSLIYFTHPPNRTHYKKLISKYLNECETIDHFILLRKIMSYVKVSDKNLCEKYWNRLTKLLESEKTNMRLLQLSYNYINFNTDIDNYRHYNFEHTLEMLIKNQIDKEIVKHLPSKLCGLFCFLMVYGSDRNLALNLLNHLEENSSQLNYINALNLTQCIENIREHGLKSLYPHIKTLKNLINKIIVKELNLSDSLTNTNMLLKTQIINNSDTDLTVLRKILEKIQKNAVISSKFIENTVYCFITGSILVPSILDSLSDFVVLNKDDILGFNVERVLYLFFYLGYQPKNSDVFFDSAVDIILRDLERLSGLALLQSSLSLCYFNKLPKSFIKLIFNVEFLEKLDKELANCYSKDKYPIRVRNSIMHLNRAVCLGCPEENVPWFHEKYVEQAKQEVFKKVDTTSIFFSRVKQYLIEIVKKQEFIMENVITPYGYHIDFVLNLNSKNEVVEPKNANIKNRLAILLLKPKSFTKIFEQIKGKYQLKIRHLEMLGYHVVTVKYHDWLNLSYADQRIEYLNNLICLNEERKLTSIIER